jgi:lysine 2,3-aminomutase
LQLFQGLVSIRIKPLYLFHVDPVDGVTHFATGVEKGLDLIKELRSHSSLLLPKFAIDLPDGGGKINLEPSYAVGEAFIGHDDCLYDYY